MTEVVDECIEKLLLKSREGYMWGCGLRPHPHLYRSSSRVDLFSVERG